MALSVFFCSCRTICNTNNCPWGIHKVSLILILNEIKAFIFLNFFVIYIWYNIMYVFNIILKTKLYSSVLQNFKRLCPHGSSVAYRERLWIWKTSPVNPRVRLDLLHLYCGIFLTTSMNNIYTYERKMPGDGHTVNINDMRCRLCFHKTFVSVVFMCFQAIKGKCLPRVCEMT